MPISGLKYLFHPHEIANAPTEQGIYMLWDGEELVFIGRAVGRYSTIKSVLSDHCSGFAGPCTQKATHCGWEVSNYPAAREAELMDEFMRRHRRLPRCHGESTAR